MFFDRNPIAVMLVANGQGLIAVNKPSKNAVTMGKLLLLSKFYKNSVILAIV